MEGMEYSDSKHDYSSNSTGSLTSTDSSDTCSMASSMAINSEESSYGTNSDSEDDVSTIKPYQFEPNVEEMLDASSSEELLSEDEGNDERLTNTDW